jgi:hypothetical protein
MQVGGSLNRLLASVSADTRAVRLPYAPFTDSRG